MPDADLVARVGSALGGEFEVRGTLGRNGRATLLDVWSVTTGARVPVKVIAPGAAWDQPSMAAFRSAMAAVSRLAHPAIAPIAFVNDASGLALYGRSYVTGSPLGGTVQGRGLLAPADAVGVILPVMEALEQAHAAGVIHGGIRPGNVIVESANGRATLTDFGVARLASLAPGQLAGVAGDPLDAPEIAANRMDARTDVFGVSRLIMALTTVSGADQLPRWLISVLMRGLAREPRDRYPTIPALADVLRRGLGSTAAEAVSTASLWDRLSGPAASTSAATPIVLPAAMPALVPEPAAISAAPPPTPVAVAVVSGRRLPWPWIMLVVALAGAMAVWFAASRPRLTLVNRLVVPVLLHSDGDTNIRIAAGATTRQRIPTGGARLSWEIERPTAGTLPVGERVGADIDLDPSVRSPRIELTASSGRQPFFAPLISNTTGVPLRIIVNAGLATARDCGCTVPAGARRMAIGYFRLYANSSVEARDAAGNRARFQQLGQQVTDSSGALGIRFNPGDLRPARRSR